MGREGILGSRWFGLLFVECENSKLGNCIAGRLELACLLSALPLDIRGLINSTIYREFSSYDALCCYNFLNFIRFIVPNFKVELQKKRYLFVSI